MNRIIHNLLIGWLLLLGTLLLTTQLSFPGSGWLSRGLMWVVFLALPLVIVLLLLHVVLGLREAFHRFRVLRRALKWKRKEPRTPWPGDEWDA